MDRMLIKLENRWEISIKFKMFQNIQQDKVYALATPYKQFKFKLIIIKLKKIFSLIIIVSQMELEKYL